MRLDWYCLANPSKGSSSTCSRGPQNRSSEGKVDTTFHKSQMKQEDPNAQGLPKAEREPEEISALNHWRWVAERYKEHFTADLAAVANTLRRKDGTPLKFEVNLETHDPIFLYRSINTGLRKIEEDPGISKAMIAEVNRIVGSNAYYRQFLDARDRYARAIGELHDFETYELEYLESEDRKKRQA